MNPQDVLASLHRAGHRPRLAGYSALDRYFKVKGTPTHLWIQSTAELVDLARLFEGLEYPGLEGVEAALSLEDTRIYFLTPHTPPPHPLLALTHDPSRDAFQAPDALYPLLRSPTLALSTPFTLTDALTCAVLLSRYPYTPPPTLPTLMPSPRPAIETQAATLSLILTGQTPWHGLALLSRTEALPRLWPPLARLRDVHHVKDYHPEGSVWEHTLEALKHRKRPDLLLSLAILLHDIGKPDAVPHGTNRFHLHANIGARIARTFLRDLGFPSSLQDDVAFLVRYHMLPGALPRIPPQSIAEILSSPLFPVLLELYRCDLSSTFRGPQPYYQACRAYRSFLKARRNPFRDPRLRRLIKLYVE
ncbi:HD domain-containing protein [Spirochaeta thermophila]|uniref:HD domain-containing protein n=1 Tax=Winmispira thermophila (strain ATCC 49972 / DSM 6192 / RI 19.B1) TaxID=665571 RepID=E0RTX5_WINT6|nr:HD domain-containing protein [Spirochaeta thermophila]ADN01031.1 hypothetical protein STHERM_c00550 [Spirochaeta thermophila DSM 6192]